MGFPLRHGFIVIDPFRCMILGHASSITFQIVHPVDHDFCLSHTLVHAKTITPIILLQLYFNDFIYEGFVRIARWNLSPPFFGCFRQPGIQLTLIRCGQVDRDQMSLIQNSEPQSAAPRFRVISVWLLWKDRKPVNVLIPGCTALLPPPRWALPGDGCPRHSWAVALTASTARNGHHYRTRWGPTGLFNTRC